MQTPELRSENVVVKILSLIDAMPSLDRQRLTTRLVQILALHPDGLTKEDLLEKFYVGFQGSSELRRASLQVCLNKLLQRARARFRAQGLDVVYIRASRRWHVRPVAAGESLASRSPL